MSSVNFAQFLISLPLALVLTFGIGFILNMLLKTTWLPLIIYLFIAGYFFLSLATYHMVDMSVLLFGLLGVALCGWTIKTLRVKGYRMF